MDWTQVIPTAFSGGLSSGPTSYWILSLIPEKVRERVRDYCKDCNKVILEGSNGHFSRIEAGVIKGYKLEVYIPFVLDLELVGLAIFVVQYLEVY